MVEGKDDPKPVERKLAETEVALTILRDQAINDLIKGGTEQSYTSNVRNTDTGLKLSTAGLKAPNLREMEISGAVEAENVWFNPMESGLRLPSPGAHAEGNFVVKDKSGKVVERDKFEFFGSNVDDLYGRPDKATMQVLRFDSKGNIMQTYKPAISEEKIVGGHYVNDANGQPVRVAKLSEGAANCGLENPGSYGNRRTECNYLISDPRYGSNISYNETVSDQRNTRRAVVRMGETPIAIVEQRLVNDKDGNLSQVVTEIRRPVQIKQR